jgi:citrate synthase
MSSAYIPGLEGIVASQTAISMVDGANGRLVYQGYVIADLAENMSFEEVAFLLWKGRLPTRAELDALALELASSRALTQAATITLNARCPGTRTPWTSSGASFPCRGSSTSWRSRASR